MRTEYPMVISARSLLRDEQIKQDIGQDALKRMKKPIYAAGELVNPNVIYEVHCGKVGLVRKDTETDQTRIVEVFGKGDLVGLDDIYNDTYTNSASFLTTNAVVRPQKFDLQDLCTLESFQKETEKRIRKQEAISHFLKTSNSPQKVAFALLDLANESCDVELDLATIASRIGVRRGGVSSVVRSLTKDEYIERVGLTTLHIKDVDGLKRKKIRDA